MHIVDANFLSRPMLRLLAEAEAFLVRNTRNAFAYDGLDRKEVPEYPRNVLREALVNAVAHRNYFDPNAIQVNIFDDRIEVLNPGALPEGLSLESLGSYSVQRNPVVYKLLRDVRKVEGLATGIPKIRETLGEQGFPAPIFEELGGKFFRLTIRNREGALPDWISPRQKRGLLLLEKSGSISTAQYAEANGISRTASLADISELIEKGLLERSGQTKGSKYRLVRK